MKIELKKKKIVILTSGGDAPGMNPVIAAIAHYAARNGYEIVGVFGGWRGLMFENENEKDDWDTLNLQTVLDIADMRGTYLRTARCDEWNPQRNPNAAQLHKAAAERLKKEDIGAVIVIGGDGSFQGAKVLYENGGIPFIGIPGTIDNDLAYTDRTLGFDSAVTTCTEAVRCIRATSRSHGRPHVVQVMGRFCGDIALATAKATGCEMVIVPEYDWDIDFYARRLNKLVEEGNTRATLILSEHSIETENDDKRKRYNTHMIKNFDWVQYLRNYGEKVVEGEELTAERFALLLRYKAMEYAADKRGMTVAELPSVIKEQYEVRSTVLGYIQRGGIPTADDCEFGSDAGYLAVELLSKGIANRVIGLKGTEVMDWDMEEALALKKSPDADAFCRINSIGKPEDVLVNKRIGK